MVYQTRFCWAHHDPDPVRGCSARCETHCGEEGLERFLGLCIRHAKEILPRYRHVVRYYEEAA